MTCMWPTPLYLVVSTNTRLTTLIVRSAFPCTVYIYRLRLLAAYASRDMCVPPRALLVSCE